MERERKYTLTVEDIKHLREDILKIGRPILAEMLGITPKAVELWERKVNIPCAKNMVRLCELWNENL